MADAPVPIHYMGRHYKLNSDITDRLNRGPHEAEKVYREDRALNNEDGDRLHGHQRSIVRNAFRSALEEHLEDYEKHLRKAHGDKYEDHQGTTLHHLDEKKGLKWGRKMAKSIALKAAEVVGGPTLREFYEKKENEALLNRFVEGELAAIGQQLNVPLHSVDDLAKLLMRETYALRGVVDGTDREAAQHSVLSQIIGAYSDSVTGVSHNRRSYDVSVTGYISQGPGDNYRHFLDTLNEDALEQHGARATPVMEKRQARNLWTNSGRRGFALPETEVPGLQKNAHDDHRPGRRRGHDHR